jgi:hypothetical protein
MNNLKNQIGRIEVKEEDLEGKSTTSPFFIMMSYVVAVRNGARDWGTGIALNLTNIGQEHKIQHDHIFPKTKLAELLKQKYPGEDGEAQVKKLVNDMSNIAFLSQRENPRKSDRLPKVYLKRILEKFGEQALTAQFVPLEESLWEMDRYEDFLVARRSLLVSGMNKLMDELSKEPTKQEIAVETNLRLERAIAERILAENKIHVVGNQIISLLGDCNKICNSKEREEVFKPTNTLVQKLAVLGKPVENESDFGNLIDASFEVFYEGSGCLQRIPDDFKDEDFVLFSIKHIRNDLRHDLEHGDVKEVDAKKMRLATIYRHYSGKTAFASFDLNDYAKVQLLILEELKTFMENLKLYCINIA